jgi:hypothetical protein
MASYTTKLEGDAGYCNDRTVFINDDWSNELSNSDTIIPYGGTNSYFGAFRRNTIEAQFSPTLSCPRGKVDLYSYANNAGNGNGQLAYPIALLTADEMSLAGIGAYGSFSASNSKSYIYSGENLGVWSLSPASRVTTYNGTQTSVLGIDLFSSSITDLGTHNSIGVRPSISLAPGTTVLGSGTATDPWVVQ